MDFVKLSLGGFDDFLVYFVSSLVLLALFVAIYLRVTPYRELALIREGNVAAAASLSGAILGFILPLASAIAHSVNFADMVTWGAIALVVQIAAYCVARLLLPRLTQAIPEGRVAEGTLLGVLSFGVGILNAACMTY